MLRVIVAMLIALVPASFACAHKPSDSYLTLRVDGAEIRGRWDIALRDSDYAIGLDRDQDGALTWGEVRARQGAIAAYALARLGTCSRRIGLPGARDGAPDRPAQRRRLRCHPLLLPECASGRQHSASPTGCSSTSTRNTADCFNLEHGSTVRSAIFSPQYAQQQFAVRDQLATRPVPRLRCARRFAHLERVRSSVVCLHVSLLLPAVLVLDRGRWQPAPRFGAALWEVTKVVTAFTLAHSLTLSLAALGLASIPSRLAESAIAVR